jgi:hypothetical protein
MVSVCLSVMAQVRTAGQASGEPAVHVRLVAPPTRGAVRRAVLGAARRLERPDCRRLLTDFTDQSGRPLGEIVVASGTTASRYLLEALWFVDGSDAPQCRDDHTVAFTAVGSRAIHVCGPQFVQLSSRQSKRAEILVIHELLHALGLGENPPLGAEITGQVMRRCGGS